MTETEIRSILQRQHAFFESGATRSVDDRLEKLRQLRKAMQDREADIAQALRRDLGKSAPESYMCESGLAMSEISWLIRHTRKLSKEHRVRTPLAQYVSRSYRKPGPYGTVLIMSPWNYPVLLSIDPLADAVAAGNTVVLKPSAYSPESSALLSELIAGVFPPEWVSVVTGGRAENSALLHQKWDMIFFTGSQAVGRTVMKSAAEYLTPVVLELGGKSPCIVDETAKIPLAARRIVWGKYLNCGQTCVAPDYILCKEGMEDTLAAALKEEIRRQFGDDPLSNPDYGKIVNEKHFRRICRLIDDTVRSDRDAALSAADDGKAKVNPAAGAGGTDKEKVPAVKTDTDVVLHGDNGSPAKAVPTEDVSDIMKTGTEKGPATGADSPASVPPAARLAAGGGRNEKVLKIEPTILSGVTWDDPVMGEEIFGPVLPILTYKSTEDLPAIVNSRAKPLALYIFSENKETIRYVTENCQFGGGCVNDVVIHLATPYMPFGGVGESGMGAYHGEKGFMTFSHTKSICDKKTWIDLPMRYQPFRGIYNTMVKWFVR